MASSSNPSAQATSHHNQLGKRKAKEEPASSSEDDDVGVYRPKNLWRHEEDVALLNHIVSHGPLHWNVISQKLTGRSPDGCRNRWWSQLFPDIYLNPLLVEEVLSKMNGNTKYDQKRDLLNNKRRKLADSTFENSGRRHNYAVMSFIPPTHRPPQYFDFLGVGSSPSPSRPPSQYFDFLGVGLAWPCD